MPEALKERSEIQEQYKWDLTRMYADDAAWEKALDAFDAQLQAPPANLPGVFLVDGPGMLAVGGVSEPHAAHADPGYRQIGIAQCCVLHDRNLLWLSFAHRIDPSGEKYKYLFSILNYKNEAFLVAAGELLCYATG